MRQLVKQKLLHRIRLLEPNAHLEGYDKEFDIVVNLSSLKLLNPEIFDDHPPTFFYENLPEELKKLYSDRKTEYLERKNAVDILVEKVEKDTDVINLIERYNLLHHFEDSYLKKKDEADYYLSKSQKINATATPLKTNDLFALERSLRKDINKTRDAISDREAIKISLSIQNAGAIISVVSSFFLISGYLYNRLLLGAFDIEVSIFFTLTDYLASSIDAIRYSASGAVIATGSYFWGVHSASRKSVAQIEFERKKREYWPYIVLLIFIFSSIFAYIRNSIVFYNNVYIIILSATVVSAPWLAKRYFKEPLVTIFIIVFIFTFSGHMFVSLEKTIYRLKYDSQEKIERYKIIFKNEMPIEPSKLVLITGNSNYLFFLDEERNAVIIPKDQVQYITRITSDKKPNK
ncbi:MAG: hypothetical protein HZB79_01900 [Deltaproteobacteria bacterium]|nr:hypothetical protein [Deltaproteobacteria bacterium]